MSTSSMPPVGIISFKPYFAETPLVTDIYLTQSTGPSNSIICGVDFRSDGTIYEVVGLNVSPTYNLLGNDDTPDSHTGEWVNDISSPLTGSEWEIACTSIVSGSWTSFPTGSGTGGVGTYVALSSNREWNVNRDGAKGYVAGTSSCIANFRLRNVSTINNYVDFQVDVTATQT